jgi:hypothetical protein
MPTRRFPVTRRFTETNKWEDPWFRRLPPAAKTLFEYLRDRCDIAGFWEVDLGTAAFFTGLPESENATLGQPLNESCASALEVLTKPPTDDPEFPKVILDDEKKWAYITNFLKQQGNWPVNVQSSVGLGIRKAFILRKSFGRKMLEVISKKTGVPIPEGFFNPCERHRGGLPNPPGKGKGTRGGTGETHPCVKQSKGGCSGSGIHIHGLKTASPWWLCDAHQKEWSATHDYGKRKA